jgi:hypothetical protein
LPNEPFYLSWRPVFTDEAEGFARIGAIGAQKLACVLKVACQRFGVAKNRNGSVSVSSGHRFQDLESKTLSAQVHWIGEERVVNRDQREFGTVLCQQHLAGARANNAVFRERRQAE